MVKAGNQRVDNPHGGRLAMWLAHHGYSIVASIGRLLRRPGATLLTTGVMAVALALPLGLWLALANVQRLGGALASSHEIAVFLRADVEVAQARALATRLQARSDVMEVAVVAPTQALAQLRQRVDLAAAIDALGEQAAQAALPSMLRVVPRGEAQGLVGALQALPEVERVQYDARWRARLQAWLGFGARVVQVLAGFLGLGVLLVVGNTVRLDIQARREEIGVLQLLGASDGFICRPFLYQGAWYGFVAGALAFGVLALAGIALQPALTTLAAQYGSNFQLQGLSLRAAVGVLAGAGVLGWLGAVFVTGHYLRQTRPGVG